MPVICSPIIVPILINVLQVAKNVLVASGYCLEYSLATEEKAEYFHPFAPPIIQAKTNNTPQYV